MKDSQRYQELLELAEWQIQVRRDFHQYPELSEVEYQTQEKLINYLNEMSINNFPCAETGVCGVLLAKNSDVTIGLRADIDALPITELLDYDFKSQNPGIMHACGHDAHMAIQLAVAKYYVTHPEKLRCNLKFIFQPAEETIGGAQRMIVDGIMETPKVDYIIGLHVMPYLEVGKIETKFGKLNAASDSFKVTVRGKAAHGAYPQNGIDSIVVASEMIMSLQTIISRNVSPLDQAVLTIGTINGGNKNNIICDEVVFTGGIRTTDEPLRHYIKTRITEIVEGIARVNGAEGKVEFEAGYKALINHNEVVEIIREVGIQALGKEGFIEKEMPSMGVEDFSYFLDYAKGAFYHLGCGNDNSVLHSPEFSIDEACLIQGTYLQIEIIDKIMDRIANSSANLSANPVATQL